MNMFSTTAVCFVPLLIITALFLICGKSFSAIQALMAILAGLLALIPITATQYFLTKIPTFSGDTLGTLLLTAFIFNGLIEESFKMGALFLIPSKKATINTFLAAGILAGFSLGSFETVIYLITGSKAIYLRLCTAAVIHAVCAGLSALFIWSIKVKKTTIRPLLTAIILHGLYNYFAGTTTFWWFSIVTILYAIIRLRFFYKQFTDSPDTPTAI